MCHNFIMEVPAHIARDPRKEGLSTILASELLVSADCPIGIARPLLLSAKAANERVAVVEISSVEHASGGCTHPVFKNQAMLGWHLDDAEKLIEGSAIVRRTFHATACPTCLLVVVWVVRNVIRAPKKQCRRDRQSTRQLNIEARIADEQELFCDRARWKAKIALEISPQFLGVGFIGECEPWRAENILRDSADISAVGIRYDRHRVPATLHGFNKFPSARNYRDIAEGKTSITAILDAVVPACIRGDERPVQIQ